MIKRLGILILVVFMVSLALPATMVAAEGLGLAGNFYHQHYELAPGEVSAESDVYVVVTNPNDSSIRVKMITDAPSGVVIHLTQEDFTIAKGGQQRVNITVEAGLQAVPGDYTLTISAEAVREGTGIKVTAGTQQQASLSILGEAGYVAINSTNEEGDSFSAVISIYEQDNNDLEKVRSGQGALEARLKPGNYIARALFQEMILAEQSFSLANQEDKMITLTCPTIYLSEFTLSPTYSNDNNLINLKVGYTIANLQKVVPELKAVLKVSQDDEALEEIELASFSQMDVGSRSGTYNYNPAQGWQQKHKYALNIELFSKDTLRYQSQKQEFIAGETIPSLVSSTSPVPSISPEAETENISINPILIGVIIAGLIIIAVIVIWLIIRKHHSAS